MAIMRLWHGRVPREKGDAYEKFLIERAVPDYGSIDGILKLYFTRRDGKTRSTSYWLLSGTRGSP